MKQLLSHAGTVLVPSVLSPWWKNFIKTFQCILELAFSQKQSRNASNIMIILIAIEWSVWYSPDEKANRSDNESKDVE